MAKTLEPLASAIEVGRTGHQKAIGSSKTHQCLKKERRKFRWARKSEARDENLVVVGRSEKDWETD